MKGEVSMRRVLLISVLLIFVVGFAGGVEAGLAGLVSGKVYDAYTGRPIGFGTLSVTGSTGGFRTSPEGYYLFHWPAGDYLSFTASAYGYNTSAARTLYLAPGQVSIQNFSLVPANPCAATLTDDAELYIPIMYYAGGQYYSVDMKYQTTSNGFLLFKVTSLPPQTYSSRYYGCASSISTLSTALKVHVPRIIYQNSSMWADFEYYPTTDGYTWLKLTNFGYY